MNSSALSEHNVAVEVDATGLKCPMPVLRAQRALRGLRSGEVLRLLADDAVARKEVPLFCEQTGTALVRSEEQGAVQVYYLRK